MAVRLALVLNDAAQLDGLRAPLVRAAEAAGWEVVAVAPPGPAADGRVVPWRLRRRSTGPLSEARSLRDLHRILRELEPDLVHGFTVKPVVYGSLAARRLGVPAVATVTGLGQAFLARGPLGRLLRAVVEASYRRALRGDVVAVFQNRDDRDLFVRRRLVDPARTRVIPGSGVDTTRFRPTPLPEAPVVVLPARMLRTKGVEDYVAAARLLRERGVPAQLVLVGEPDPQNAATLSRRRLEAWEREGVVGWWGRRDDMAAVYASARVVCLPSHGEGVPNVLLEGAACGRPLVATDVAGCRDVVRDGETGLLVPPRDPAALADALERVLADDDLARRLGAAARRLVEGSFAVGQVNEAYLSLYDGLLNRTA